jgi:hypothetical protein
MKNAAIVLGLCLLGCAAAVGAADSSHAPSNEDCLSCHGDKDAARENGKSVFVDQNAFSRSVHGEAGLSCVDCHADLAKATEFPHPEKLEPVQCASCHEEQVTAYSKSVHAEVRRKHNGKSLTAGCVDCHGTHDILSSKDPKSPTYVLNVPATCERCHGNPEVIQKGHIAIGNVGKLYEDSIHGRAVLKSGLVTAPTCETCHGMHDIRRSSDPESSIFRNNIPSKCGSCHQGIEKLYDLGVHGSHFREGDKRAPVCTDCHTAHHIRQADVEAWRLDVTKECGTCHRESIETFRDTYHGQVTNLGYARIATCSDCHRPHDILPAADPNSAVSAANRLKTCQKCHPGASEKFAEYDPHPNPKDRARDPLLYYAGIFMKWLLIGVMAFFGLHTVLWFPAHWFRRNGAGSDGDKDEGPGGER